MNTSQLEQDISRVQNCILGTISSLEQCINAADLHHQNNELDAYLHIKAVIRANRNYLTALLTELHKLNQRLKRAKDEKTDHANKERLNKMLQSLDEQLKTWEIRSQNFQMWNGPRKQTEIQPDDNPEETPGTGRLEL